MIKCGLLVNINTINNVSKFCLKNKNTLYIIVFLSKHILRSNPTKRKAYNNEIEEYKIHEYSWQVIC